MLLLAISFFFSTNNPLKHLSVTYRCMPTFPFRVTSVSFFFYLEIPTPAKKLPGRGKGNDRQPLAASLRRFFFFQYTLQNACHQSLLVNDISLFAGLSTSVSFFNGPLFFNMSQTAISEFYCSHWMILKSLSFDSKLPSPTKKSVPSLQKS